jgi:hypothetical protein
MSIMVGLSIPAVIDGVPITTELHQYMAFGKTATELS